jgi:DNA-binding NarL/FixJ family response regulator
MDGVRKMGEVPPNSSKSGDHEIVPGDAACRAGTRNLLILSDIRFLREGLAAALACDGAFVIVGVAGNLDEALPAVTARPPPLILVDAGLPDGLATVTRLRQLVPLAQIVAFALSETEAEVIAWAEAGVCGYLPRSAALSELADFLDKIMRREQICSTRIAAGLLRWIAKGPRIAGPKVTFSEATALTTREDQVARLVVAGLSNKEIARRLDIGLATVKSHVHNILGKLALERRGQLVRWARGGEQLPFQQTWAVAPETGEQP